MAIPGFQDIMLPMLERMADGEDYNIRDMVEILAEDFNLSNDERNELLDSGQVRFDNRVHWARAYLVKGKLLESVGRGLIKITQRGLDVLDNPPNRIDIPYLRQFEDSENSTESTSSTSETTLDMSDGDIANLETEAPDELMSSTFRQLHKALIEDLLEALYSLSYTKFEHLVVGLLLKMGYGSSLDSGEHLGKSGDGGVDGVIWEDSLGLNEIYIQAKQNKRDNGVSARDIRDFLGSLNIRRANKGVIITTSYFTQEAKKAASSATNRIVLIDGEQLATLMIEHNVGVSIKQTYAIKQVDKNFFESA